MTPQEVREVIQHATKNSTSLGDADLFGNVAKTLDTLKNLGEGVNTKPTSEKGLSAKDIPVLYPFFPLFSW
jgi:hypothetical protein